MSSYEAMVDVVPRRTDTPASARGTEDMHFTESLAAAVIEEYSNPGDVVLDPFGGFGTTPYVAVRMGRRPIAVELLEERASYIRQRLHDDAEVITGDARQLSSLVNSPVELCLTSPPYMTVTGHPQNPLTGYTTADGDYRTYLAEFEAVFRAVTALLRPGGHAVVNVANLVTTDTVTPLAWDIGARIPAPGVAPGHLPVLGPVPIWDV
jgi:DNA modification methylase